MPVETTHALVSGAVAACSSSNERPSTRELFKAHAGFVLRVLRNLGVRAGDAEDVAQEVFMIAHGRLAFLRSDADPRSWLFGIARRLAANYVRKSKRQRNVPLEERDAVAEGTPASELQRARDRSLLLQALDELDGAKREVFVLFELEGLAMHDVAAMVGCPLHTAYSRLYAARSIVQRRVLGSSSASGRAER